ncbi:hypothetical protein L3Q65_00015 (plasmid) [Amycolatopsis sp. FU40]|uniref:hypothetical protein n=1 Tax=Amycolatopsis sp. FU40 TaxID=2914159 RepID=UPI001F3FF59A|nr:hypothetical protein [Amycolatopsis sp. FU40]UKD50744.1 hypothetical protein L3Q65_00015 [Amycolatopsis sp. FU40]
MTAPDGGPNKRSADRDRKLADLAADLRKTRGEVADVRNTVGDLAATISEWAPQLVDVQKDLAQLGGQVEELLESPDIKNAPVNWPELPAEDAEREWAKLGEWVHEILGGWYLVTRGQLPDCWPLHRPAFLQLAWLRSSHIESYLSRTHPSQAAEWNVRWLDAALSRVATYIPDTKCRAVPGKPGEHLVDQLHAQQHRTGQQPAPTGANPFPNPYAQQQPGSPAPPVPPTPAVPSSARDEVIRWDYWGGYFNQAMRADLAWRREREAAAKNGG